MARKNKIVVPAPKTLTEQIADAERWAAFAREKLREQPASLTGSLAQDLARIVQHPWDIGSCDQMFERSAALYVNKVIIARLDENIPLATIIETVRDEVLRGAKYPTRSTSVTSSLYEQCKTKAYANVLETLTMIASADEKVAALKAALPYFDN